MKLSSGTALTSSELLQVPFCQRIKIGLYALQTNRPDYVTTGV